MFLGLAVLAVAVPLIAWSSRDRGQTVEPPVLPRGAGWLVLGLALHVGWLYGISRLAHLPSWLCWWPLLADAPIAAFAISNWRVPGVPVALLGLALNAAAMAANGGLMPVAMVNVPGPHVAARFDGDRVRGSLDRVTGPDAPLAFLGDVVPLGRAGGLGLTFSIGDVLVACGGTLAAAGIARAAAGSEATTR